MFSLLRSTGCTCPSKWLESRYISLSVSGVIGHSTCGGQGTLLMQPLYACCMRVLLQFRIGAHSLPVAFGCRTSTPLAQRLRQQCDQHAVGDKRHMVVECTASQGVTNMLRICDSACTMQQLCGFLAFKFVPSTSYYHWCRTSCTGVTCWICWSDNILSYLQTSPRP